MVSLKIQLLATILFVSQSYGQLGRCPCGYNQRYGPPQPQPGGVISAGQFVVPAVIKPLNCPCQSSSDSQPTPYPSRRPPSVTPCPDVDDECELDRVLYALISSLLDNKRSSGRRSGYNPSYSYDGNSEYGDCYDRSPSYDRSPCYDRSPSYDRSSIYEPRSPGYCDDYDYTQPSQYSPPPNPYCVCSTAEPYTVTTSCDNNNCPEISVIIKPASDC